MRTPEQPLHIAGVDKNPAIKRHRTVRYYAHRVQESLTSQVTKFVCAMAIIVFFIIGMIAFILWLSLRPHRPRFHVRDFAVPSLPQPDGFQNAEITFTVTARNSNMHVGFFYDSIVGNVYYKDQKIGSTPMSAPFYQQPKNTTVFYTVLSGATLTVTSQRWSEFLSERDLKMVPFRLDITSVIRFRLLGWTSHGHRMHASCDVSVGPDGLILEKFKNLKCLLYFF